MSTADGESPEEVELTKTPISRVKSSKSLASEFGLSASPTPGTESELAPFLNQLKRVAREKGYGKKEATVIWRDVRVLGSKALVSEGIPSFGDPFRGLLMLPLLPLLLLRPKPKVTPTDNSATLLHATTGFLRPGEMLLVLGKPGAGAGPLVRVLGKTPERLKALYREVAGDVTINGLGASEFKKRFQNEVLYSGDNDLHIPALTVRQTLSAALSFKVGHTSSEKGVDAVKAEFLTFLEEWLGMTTAMDTVVGNEFLRGVSGGEKKRVSIAEQLTGSAAVNVWDQTTRGLDSTYALQVIKGLRLVTTALKRTTVVHINQTGDSIFQLFDRVLLLSKGRTIYFGSSTAAKDYFQKLGFRPLPRQSVPDFLNSVTEVKERALVDGVDPATVPSTAEEFEKAWLRSENYRAMTEELKSIEEKITANNSAQTFQESEHAYRVENFSSKPTSAYSRTGWEQFNIALSREFLLMRGQPSAVIGQVIFVVLVALCTGSVNFRQPLTALGAFSRGGTIFFSLLFNAIQTQTELPRMISERSYVYKHKEWSLYHAGLRYMSWVVADTPIRIINTILFGTILYWMAGLNPDPVRFFTFLLFNFFSGACYSSFSRFITALSPNIDTATRFNAIWLIPNLIYCGYLIPYSEVKPWFIWFVWVSPLSYSFRALMGNEFRGLQFECTDIYVVPPYPGVPDVYKTCNLQGAKPGSMIVDGSDYVSSAFGFDASLGTSWWNFGAVMALWFVFLVLSAVVSEIAEFGGSGINRMIFQKGRIPHHDEYLESEAKLIPSEQIAVDVDVEAINPNIINRVASLKMTTSLNLTWRNLSYWIQTPTGERQLLDNVSGAVRPGRMLALMGFTGAGKTTLQDVLTRRKTAGRIDGTVFVGSLPQTTGFKRIMGYAEQMDVHTPTATIREALRFSAYLRQPSETSVDEKNRFVEEIINLMGLNDIADAMVGTLETGVGINLTDRKRLTIAIELCARPEFLVLDEPTSGLDSYAAFQIVKLLHKLAEKGQAILCTIHQPSAILFEHFDDLLLLGPGGKPLYFGEIGPESVTVTSYFEKRGAASYDKSENPAEYILDAGNGLRNANPDAPVDWVQLWKDSDEAKSLEDVVQRLRNTPVDVAAQELQTQEFSLSTFQQIPIVTARLFTTYWRSPDYTFGRVIISLINGILLSLSFFQVTGDRAGLFNRIFSVFMTAAFSVATVQVSMPFFTDMKTYFLRESAQGFYNWFAFSVAVTVVESIFFFVIYYFVAGLSGTSSVAATFLLFHVLLQLFAVSMGQWIAALMPNLPLSTILAGLITTLLPGFSGIPAPFEQMPKFW
ncbi:hypothetical protein HDU93_002754 [Gonapodya sp. JEL0774]|nr:hypothetical protein HDU93_002754 [Gonapodya sp. JEL0774]